MRLSARLSPAAEPLPDAQVTVIVDVLRASTSLAVAAARGIARILVVEDPEQARALKTIEELRGALLGGERGGRKIEGFDLGNSPLEYLERDLAGRTLLFTSTNGSRAARAAPRNDCLFGAFVNGAALVRSLVDARSVQLICGGDEGRFSIEDAACTGWIVRRLLEAGAAPQLDAGARAALTLAPLGAAGVRALIHGADHGRALRAMGADFARDVEFCSRIDGIEAVPRGERARRPEANDAGRAPA